MIFHNKPTLGHEEIKAVKDVIKSGWLVQGKKTEEFENELCRYIGLQEGDGVALSSPAQERSAVSKGLKGFLNRWSQCLPSNDPP